MSEDIFDRDLIDAHKASIELDRSLDKPREYVPRIRFDAPKQTGNMLSVMKANKAFLDDNMTRMQEARANAGMKYQHKPVTEHQLSMDENFKRKEDYRFDVERPGMLLLKKMGLKPR